MVRIKPGTVRVGVWELVNPVMVRASAWKFVAIKSVTVMVGKWEFVTLEIGV